MIIVSSRHRLKQKYDKYPELANGWHLSFQEGYNCTPPGKRTYLFLDVPDACPLINPDQGLMTGEQMIRMLRFLTAWVKEEDSHLVVSCGRGRSRSTAGALIANYLWSINWYSEATCGQEPSYVWRPDYHHANAVYWLFENYPKSTPNGWMLKLADALLTREFQAVKDSDGRPHLEEVNLFKACRERFVKWTEKRPA